VKVHLLWAGVVLLLATLAAYCTLAITGHDKAASDLGGGTVLMIILLPFMYGIYLVIRLDD
jgi:hypothetical protein